MNEIRAKLTARIQRTHNVFSFRFEPPQKIPYLPGQFTQVIFDEQDLRNKRLNKYLSYSCAPGRYYFEVTKKISDSSFSARLMGLKEGDAVLFRPPMGHCVFEPSMTRVGFIIGGIGITPVISIVEYIAEQGLATDVRLLYSNWSAGDIAFREELDCIGRACANIHPVYILGECRPEDSGCFSGCITREFVADHIPDYDARHIFIFGPPGMVTAMTDICRSLGCARDRLKIENFIGY